MNIISYPSKMPCGSFSLPARVTCPAAALCMKLAKEQGKRAICDKCYACRAFYLMTNVKKSQFERLEWRNKAMADGSFVPQMVDAIGQEGDDFFRVHDSGSFDSPAYVNAWEEITRQLPDVNFWIPTREWVLSEYLPDLRSLARLPNVTVRPSALFFDDPAPVVPGLHAGTSASKTNYDCPAPKQNNACGDCRKCWLAKDASVGYKEH